MLGHCATATTPAEAPSGTNPKAPLDRMSSRCAGPLARLGAATLDARSHGSPNPSDRISRESAESSRPHPEDDLVDHL
jgi:hypothetical protein